MSGEVERKNFSTVDINTVFEEQGRACANCGLPLNYGYEAHHKDGNSNNNSKENCELLCERCHDAKKYETLQAQKKRALEQTNGIIDAAIQGKMAGAVIDKLLDAIKLSLSLNTQINGDSQFKIPANLTEEFNVVLAQNSIRAYTDGFMDCMKNMDPVNIRKRMKLE